jgi:hypothetical protein
MSLNISEIEIRLAVGEPASAPVNSPGGRSAAPHRGASLAQHEMDELVRKCVQEVLVALRLLGDR